MIASSADWLGRLPSGGSFYAWAGAGLVAAVFLRGMVVRARAGRHGFEILHTIEAGFVAALLAAMLGFAFLQIILRNVVHTGLIWIDPLLRHLLLWIGFAGAALATRLERHINVDALTRVLPPHAMRAARIATHAVASFLCLVLANGTVQVVREEAAAGTTSFLHVPTWILQAIMPVTLGLMSARFLRHAWVAVRGAPLQDAAKTHMPIDLEPGATS